MTENQYQGKKSNILKRIPVEFRDFVEDTATGICRCPRSEDLLRYHRMIIDQLKKPISKFKQRILKESRKYV